MLWGHLRPLVVFRKPWSRQVWKFCFDAHLANFVIFDDFGHFNRKMDILDHFEDLDSLLSKSHDISAFNPRTPRDPQNSCYFDLNFVLFLDPFEGPGGGLHSPCTSCLLVGVTCSGALTNPWPGTPNFGHFDHFSHWKVNFCHFAHQRSVKCHFDPILTPFEPSWA